MDSAFILRRAEDLVVIGVAWSGGPPEGHELVASGPQTLTLTFPPQHIAEEVDRDGFEPGEVNGIPVWRSQLSAPSAVAFDVAAGTRIPLTVDGVLAAASAATYSRAGTVIELPWRVHLAPGSATWRHARAPIVSAGGIVGLWRTRAADATTAVELYAIDDGAAEETDPFEMALDRGGRTSIAADGVTVPAHARRLELTTLGGSLSAVGRWPSFDWDHEIALGRDVSVRTVTRMRMYPFDHRAELEEYSIRVFDPASGTAKLRKTEVLRFLDPIATLAGSGREAREFPFTQAEVLIPSWELPPQEWHDITRATGEAAGLQGRLDAARARRDAIFPGVEERRTRDLTWDELVAWGSQAAADWTYLSGERDQAKAALDAAATSTGGGPTSADERIADLERRIAELQFRLVDGMGQLDEGVQAQIDALQQQIDAIRAEQPVGPAPGALEALQARYDELAAAAADAWNRAEAERTADRDLQQLIDAGDTEAAELAQLYGEIATLEGRIAAIGAEGDRAYPWWVLPHDAGRPLRFPVRLRGSAGDVDIEIPMIGVKDFTLDPIGELPAFHAVSDERTRVMLAEQWALADAAEVPIPPSRVDLVRLPAPAVRAVGLSADGALAGAAGDVRVVHALRVLGAVSEQGFRPVLDAFDIELPEIETLVGRYTRARYRYVEEFLGGEAEDLVFQAVGDAVDLSFVDDARRSGALVSPRILADALSRTYGPVNLEAIRSGVDGKFDPAQLFADGATLLGWNFTDLLTNLLVPPEIVSNLLEGRPPVVTMTWTVDELTAVGPFVPGPAASLSLVAVFGAEETSVTCTLSDFALSLPAPGDGELLRVTFDALVYRQIPDAPPDLDPQGLGIEFHHQLKLLDSLREAVALGREAPAIDVSPRGIVASYSLPIDPPPSLGIQFRDVVFHAGVDVPFDSRPAVVEVGFASRQRPFVATVLMFGGGGYVDLAIDRTGIRRLEAAIEFGASLALDFLIVQAEVHVLGAIRYAQQGADITLTGYLRIGGCVQLLGLVSVSIELVVSLSYTSDDNALYGRATLVLELDLTLYSTSVELDSGPWRIAGNTPSAHPRSLAESTPETSEPNAPEQAIDPDVFLAQWRRSREAFA